jgi:hypothetical protein
MAYTVEVRCLKLVVRWLGEGHPLAGQTQRDVEACESHVQMLCALRCTRTWEVVLTLRMQTWIVAGRCALHSSMHLRAAGAFTLARRQRDGYRRRTQELEDEVGNLIEDTDRLEDELADLRERFIGMMDLAQGLEIELQRLRASQN